METAASVDTRGAPSGGWGHLRPGDVLTIEEAARILRISRTAAYGLARCYLETGEGLPVLRLGRALRVPGHRLIRLLEG
ncbi:MAG: helix-turn-helix domain-containing protein [Actinomycetota bacterium]